mmetsp:Transcript_3482/g.10016  ORF Transcript_3482/g.10016 Transcript_3482/m.10016 type:complete len:271 (+) Transcript_3482:340-1152(+)
MACMSLWLLHLPSSHSACSSSSSPCERRPASPPEPASVASLGARDCSASLAAVHRSRRASMAMSMPMLPWAEPRVSRMICPKLLKRFDPASMAVSCHCSCGDANRSFSTGLTSEQLSSWKTSLWCATDAMVSAATDGSWQRLRAAMDPRTSPLAHSPCTILRLASRISRIADMVVCFPTTSARTAASPMSAASRTPPPPGAAVGGRKDSGSRPWSCGPAPLPLPPPPPPPPSPLLALGVCRRAGCCCCCSLVTIWKLGPEASGVACRERC